MKNYATGDIPRALYLLRMLWLCFFPVFTVLVGNGVLLGVPQAREALLAFESDRALAGQAFWLYAAHLYWIALAWYTARLLVDRRFRPDTVGLCVSRAFALGVARWLPRGLALLGGLPVAAFLLLSEGVRVQGGVLLLLTLTFFWFVVRRRELLARLGENRRWLRRLQTGAMRRDDVDQFDRVDALVLHSQLLIGLFFTISALLFLGVWLGMAPVARSLGSAALLLAALACWTFFGGLVLTYLPKRGGLLAQTWLPLAAFVLFSPLNENHPVAPARGGAVAPAAVARPELADAFTQWLAARADADAPVIFVANAGGAARAAYWVGSTLGLLEDEARQAARAAAPGWPSTAFGANIFLISGTSGGALGAATFVAALDTQTPAAGPACTRSLRALSTAFAGRDHLATLVGFLLYPDLVQRFLPLAFDSLDRSRALEETWIADWDALLPPACTKAGNPWKQSFAALHQRAGAQRPLPMLALNTAALAQGRRVFQSDFRLAVSDGIDLLAEPQLEVSHLTLAQAVHNSARFPLLSPAGMVRLRDAGAIWDRLGDGGYVEASAALTVLETLRELRRAGLLRDCRRENCPKEGAGRRWLDQEQLRLILLNNEPVEADAWHCPAHEGHPADAPLTLQEMRAHAMPLPDLLAPLVGLLNSRGARGNAAVYELIREAGGCRQVAELNLPREPKAVPPSMNWMLNAASRCQIDHALEDRPDIETPAHRQLQQQLGFVRKWLKLAPPPRRPTGPCDGAPASGSSR